MDGGSAFGGPFSIIVASSWRVVSCGGGNLE